MGMNRSQRRARWQSGFRRRNAELTAATAEPAASIAGMNPRSNPVVRQPPTAVRVNIQELELRGFDRSARTIADSFRHRFSVLLATRGVPPGWTRTHLIDDARTQDVIHISAGTS